MVILEKVPYDCLIKFSIIELKRPSKAIRDMETKVNVEKLSTAKLFEKIDWKPVSAWARQINKYESHSKR